MTDRYEIEYLPVAQEDLTEIFDYIRTDSPQAASEFVDRVDEAISQLAEFPFLGSIPRDDRLGRMGYRVLVIDRYLVFYVVMDRTVEIRRMIHGTRRYSFLL